MKKISFLFASLLFIFASCDKIDQDQYVVFSGASGTWYDSEMEIPATQRAFVEKYTGVRCPNCPKADEVLHATLEKYGEQLIVAAIHVPNNFSRPFSGQEDLRTEKGTIWYNAFFSQSQPIPVALLNRQRANGALDLITPTGSFDDKIDAILAHDASIGMLLQSSSSNGNYSADVHLRFEQAVSDPLTLTVLIVEDGIITSQIYGSETIEEYSQSHVLRDVITDAWGIDVDADGQQGTQRMVRLSFQLPEQCNPANCQILAFVSNKDTREIFNAASCSLP